MPEVNNVQKFVTPAQFASYVKPLRNDIADLQNDLNTTNEFLNESSEIVYSRNRMDNSKIIDGLLQSDGSVDSTNQYYCTTDYIAVESGTAYRFCYWNESSVKGMSARYSLYYDENKNVLGVAPTSATGTLQHENLAFMRFSFAINVKETAMFLIGNTSTAGITDFIPYSKTIVHDYGKKYKVVANGDSITFGHKPAHDGYDGMTNGVSYMTLACRELGYTLDNYAISSSTLTVNTNLKVEKYILKRSCLSNADFIEI